MRTKRHAHLKKHAAVAARARATWRTNEEQYRLLFEANPCPMWICDENTFKFLNVNKAALRLYGWTRKDFLAMTAKDIRPPEDVPRFLRVVGRLRRPMATFVGEWRHVKSDGTIFDVAVTMSSIPYAGRAARLAVVTDISEAKRTQALLRQLNTTLEQRVAERTAELTEASERYRTIMDAALVGIITLDDRGTVEFANPAALHIFGCAFDEILGCNVGRLMRPAEQAPDEGFIQHCLRAANRQLAGFRGEVLGRRRDGGTMVLELALAELVRAGRRQFVAMVRDITNRKRLERELLDIGERERQRVGRDLHDGLGQHLHALFYLASLMEKDSRETAPERANYAGRLARQLEHALELTRSLARGLQPVNPAPEGLMIALRELAQRTRQLYGVDCRFICRSPVFLHRHSAANHVYRIAQEAVINAMKHGKPTRILLKLSAMPQRIILRVRDNGVGIRQTTGRAHGMGLHIMQYRADAIAGSLLVQRHPRGGTEVTCTVKRRALLPQQENLP